MLRHARLGRGCGVVGPFAALNDRSVGRCRPPGLLLPLVVHVRRSNLNHGVPRIVHWGSTAACRPISTNERARLDAVVLEAC